MTQSLRTLTLTVARGLNVILCSLFFSSQLLAQFPENKYEEEIIKKYNIDTLEVYLDSAARGYELSVKNILSVNFNKNGKPVRKIHIASDIYLTVSLDLYFYYTDSTVHVRRDSAYYKKDYEATYVYYFISHYENNLETKTLNYNEYDGKRHLDKTELYRYDKSGKLIHTETFGPENPRVRLVPTEEIFEYNSEGKLITETEKSDGVIKSTCSYVYSPGLVTINRVRYSRGQEPYKTQVKNYYNTIGQLIKKEYLDALGKITMSAIYTYNEMGLMETETNYGREGRFSYRFRSEYK